MTDIYKAPEANLNETPVTSAGTGSIESAIAGNYDFAIGEVLSEAWEKTNGSKGTIWLSFLFYFLIAIAFAVIRLILTGSIEATTSATSAILQIIESIAIIPFFAGLYLIGAKLAARVPTSANEVFAYYEKILPIVGTAFLSFILIFIGFILLILPGIYLSVAFAFAIPLAADKNLSPWQALETSRKAVSHHWFKFFGLGLVVIVIYILSAIPLGIGLIWSLPLLFLVYGVLYLRVFGLGTPTSIPQENPANSEVV